MTATLKTRPTDRPTGRRFTAAASADRIEHVAAALEANNIEAIVVADGAEARERVLAMIPQGAEVHWAKSLTLDEIGITADLAIVPLLNPLITRLLRIGLPFGPNVLLTVRGRSSGLPRTVAVAILEVDGHRYVQSPFGEVEWVRNLRAARAATITKGHDREAVEAIELTPEAEGPVLRQALAPYLRFRLVRAMLGRYFRLGTDANSDDDVAEARRHPMFELRPATSGTG
ncbi:MAG: nitroreductase family deazaflavin-dependent oxidoreductase [Candidatus Limnocylindrales bacterium]